MHYLVKEKKIVFLIGSMIRGGAERVISILANNYAAKGWDVDILMLLDYYNDYELNNRISVLPLYGKTSSRIRRIPFWLLNIRRYIKENKPDRVVSFVARINILTQIACIGLKQKIIVSERNDPKADGRSFLIKLATKMLYPHAVCIVFQTEWARSCFSKKIQSNGVIIPNPINNHIKAKKVRQQKIVAVGRLSAQKNHAMLINAFKKVLDRHPQYRLFIYGEGELRDKLTLQISSSSLKDKVYLPGNVTDIHECISDAEIFVLPSNYEGLSNALLEALMMGLPCISTDCAGSNEIIKDGINGLLIPVGDTDKLIEAIEKLIQNREYANQIAENGKIFSAAFESAKVLKLWEEIIEK